MQKSNLKELAAKMLMHDPIVLDKFSLVWHKAKYRAPSENQTH